MTKYFYLDREITKEEADKITKSKAPKKKVSESKAEKEGTAEKEVLT